MGQEKVRRVGVGSLQAVLYVVPGCPLCADLRTLLMEKNVDFIERDVANDYGALRRMFRMTKQGLVPVLELNGKTVVRPDQKELERLLAY